MTISGDLKTDAWSPESNQPLVLLTIDHTDLANPIRVVANTEDITSNGNTFTAFPFEIRLPDSNEDAPPTARLRVDNVSREIGQTIRQITSAASVTIEVVRQEALDTVELSFPSMRLVDVRFDALSVQGDLEFEDLAREPFPARTFSPAEFPGLVQ